MPVPGPYRADTTRRRRLEKRPVALGEDDDEAAVRGSRRATRPRLRTLMVWRPRAAAVAPRPAEPAPSLPSPTHTPVVSKGGGGAPTRPTRRTAGREAVWDTHAAERRRAERGRKGTRRVCCRRRRPQQGFALPLCNATRARAVLEHLRGSKDRQHRAICTITSRQACAPTDSESLGPRRPVPV